MGWRKRLGRKGHISAFWERGEGSRWPVHVPKALINKPPSRHRSNGKTPCSVKHPYIPPFDLSLRGAHPRPQSKEARAAALKLKEFVDRVSGLLRSADKPQVSPRAVTNVNSHPGNPRGGVEERAGGAHDVERPGARPRTVDAPPAATQNTRFERLGAASTLRPTRGLEFGRPNVGRSMCDGEPHRATWPAFFAALVKTLTQRLNSRSRMVGSSISYSWTRQP